jgi:hypothetical protein
MNPITAPLIKRSSKSLSWWMKIPSFRVAMVGLLPLIGAFAGLAEYQAVTDQPVGQPLLTGSALSHSAAHGADPA